MEPVFITGLCWGVKVYRSDGRLEAEREAVRGRVRQSMPPSIKLLIVAFNCQEVSLKWIEGELIH